MNLTLREASDLLEMRPRTLRDQLRRGVIRGRKQDGRWVIRKADLPLRDVDRQTYQAKIARMHADVERAVPRRLRADVGIGRLDGLDAFTITRALHAELSDGPAAGRLREALFAIALGHHQYDRDAKLAAFDAARTALSGAVVELILGDDATGLADRIECEALPRLAGLIRWAEALPPRRIAS